MDAKWYCKNLHRFHNHITTYIVDIFRSHSTNQAEINGVFMNTTRRLRRSEFHHAQTWYLNKNVSLTMPIV